jgi:hypothetical protein
MAAKAAHSISHNPERQIGSAAKRHEIDDNDPNDAEKTMIHGLVAAQTNVGI